jgi:KN motif and ankyrin repeat domain-containing protein
MSIIVMLNFFLELIPEHQTVVRRLFKLSDVNIRASKNSQTALMLAVSHGNFLITTLLVEASADINIQDDDGSTALMCAAEHGYEDIVKFLLAQPDCDSTKQDVVSSINCIKVINIKK